MKTKEFYEYLEQRKKMNKINYYLASIKELDEIKKQYPNTKPTMLLHACCAVCAGWPLEFLMDHFKVTIYYGNSNIWPSDEYHRRLNELKRFVQEEYGNEIDVIIPNYDNAAYTKVLEPRKDDPEGYKRCFQCYAIRMSDAYRYASENGFDYFTTVMSSSRQKDSQKINETGKALSHLYPNVKYFYSDFKKHGGQERREEIADEHNLYRQDYCGCVYSWEERFLDK